MNKRRTISIGLVIAMLALVGWFEPTYCVRGWLRGEAFFNDRPTSYWRRMVVGALDIEWETFPNFTWWDRVRFQLGWDQDERNTLQLAQSANSGAVLQELSRDSNSKVAGFADDLLQIDRRGGVQTYTYWLGLLKKHNMR